MSPQETIAKGVNSAKKKKKKKKSRNRNQSFNSKQTIN